MIDKLARGRPIAGLGRPSDAGRLFLALPGAGAIDAKLDVPATALIGARCSRASMPGHLASDRELAALRASWPDPAPAAHNLRTPQPLAPSRRDLTSRPHRLTPFPPPAPPFSADGSPANITVAAPAMSQGERVQRLLLTFPAFHDSLSYDPTAAFATGDQALNQQLSSALQQAVDDAGAPASSTHSVRHPGGVLALAGGVAAALLVL